MSPENRNSAGNTAALGEADVSVPSPLTPPGALHIRSESKTETNRKSAIAIRSEDMSQTKTRV